MAIGRIGCFLSGCCTGRPTASRWGLWSSDRRLAIRRYPVQLVEAACTGVIGAVALALVLTAEPHLRGAIFLGAIASYTLTRQFLFPLRSEARTMPWGRKVAFAVSGGVLLTTIIVSALA
jgi:phosphatidylglycerol:prolipoprotein diacylglycerol transferase